MSWMGKRDELRCAFLLSALLLVVFYCASSADRAPLLLAGMTPQSDSESSMHTTIPSRPLVEQRQTQKPGRVAICLVGGLRAFELTGPSIRKHLLDVYNDADLFIHAPVDADAHKLTVFAGRPHLASVRLFTPTVLNETSTAREVLLAVGSPNGIQGLLQYFSLVEGCWELIEDYEAKHNFKYDWVVRSRVDGYWNGPMESVDTFNASRYHVPYGSDFGGLNDRLGVGTRETSRVALQRLSLLPEIRRHGFKHLNSESAFQAQFNASHVEVELNTFPFCVLSKRRYKGFSTVPVASIMSGGPLNGAKCRPCTPKLVGDVAKRFLKKVHPSARIGPTDDAQLCDASKVWDRNWEEIYDSAAGPEMAEVRQRISSRSFDDCILEMESFQQQWEFWNAPSAKALCNGLKGETH